MTPMEKEKMRRTWSRMPRQERCQEWQELEGYLSWGEKHFAGDANVKVTKIDMQKGFSPDNCLIVEDHGKEAVTGEAAPLQTAVNRRLLECWKRIIDRPCAEEWMDFHSFAAWAMENGGDDLSNRLIRFNRAQPYSPENCSYSFAGYEKDDGGWRKRWNKTVNVLRVHFGLEPFEEG